MKYKGLLFALIIVLARTNKFEWEKETEEDFEHFVAEMRGSNVIPPQAVGLILEAVALAWKGLCKIFGYSIKTETIQVAASKGFSFFDSSYTIDFTTGFKATPRSLEKLKKYYHVALWPEAEDGETMATALASSLEITDVNLWSQNEVTTKATDKTMIYTAVMSMNLGNDQYNILTVNAGAKFQLSPKISILRTTKKVGIFYEGVSTRIIYTDRTISQEDIENLMYFLQMTAYKAVASQHGMILEYPKFDIEK